MWGFSIFFVVSIFISVGFSANSFYVLPVLVWAFSIFFVVSIFISVGFSANSF